MLPFAHKGKFSKTGPGGMPQGKFGFMGGKPGMPGKGMPGMPGGPANLIAMLSGSGDTRFFTPNTVNPRINIMSLPVHLRSP